jgi:hypothetical protein
MSNLADKRAKLLKTNKPELGEIHGGRVKVKDET